jgi:periplasmic divalent cation tolerance protein
MSDAAGSTEFVIVLTTLPAGADADRFAEVIVQERFAACVNVLAPMTSIYRWQGAVESAEERQLVIKTVATRVEDLKRRLESAHPYEVPEFLVLPVSGGTDVYLAWVRESTLDGTTEA